MSQQSLSDQTREALEAFVANLPAAQQETVGKAFESLMASDTADNAVNVGGKAPDFTLPSVTNEDLTLSDALSDGPVVLSFYRGSWCPFCNLELNALQRRVEDIKACGARLIAVSPEKPDSSLTHAQKLDLTFDVLSDMHNRIAAEYGLIMDVHETLRPLYLEWGLDLPAANLDESWQLPVPATYVIDRDRTVRAAHIDKNYTSRMEPDEIIKALRSL
ncbi:peroxiredoxin [Thiogranum longum]|uniref:thioredoxin-dependent peroxiredoxin n=1 Tax=Thiogranum longum TaxID=1537524 RepID=A0A4R1H8H7_9GAMM|nr:peroxiredoxin-like family protein [Thiogranum longum]TCK18144.1 peroxiredoxin [Thiogranum longum]